MKAFPAAIRFEVSTLEAPFDASRPPNSAGLGTRLFQYLQLRPHPIHLAIFLVLFGTISVLDLVLDHEEAFR
jgi:hypothetical protein